MDRLVNLVIDPKRIKEVKTNILFFLTSPVIYSLIIPALIMDAFVQLYQAICFPVYGIAKVNRDDYIKHDRHQLKYLNTLKKVNCAYCAYFNGLIAYVREVAGRTEQYWCPIKHSVAPKDRHPHYESFIPYGESEALDSKWDEKRKILQKFLSKDC